MSKQKITWPKWEQITKSIYRLAGWPKAEMKGYYEQGLSPLHAMEKASMRRAKPQPSQHNESEN